MAITGSKWLLQGLCGSYGVNIPLFCPDPPPPTRDKGLHACSHWRGEGVLLRLSWEDFPRKPGKERVFVLDNGYLFHREGVGCKYF